MHPITWMPFMVLVGKIKTTHYDPKADMVPWTQK